MEVNRAYKWFLQFWNIGIKGVVFHQEGQLGQLIRNTDQQELESLAFPSRKLRSLEAG